MSGSDGRRIRNRRNLVIAGRSGKVPSQSDLPTFVIVRCPPAVCKVHDFRDRYQEALCELIEAKMKGLPVNRDRSRRRGRCMI